MPDKEKTKLVATPTEKRKADDIEIKDLKKVSAYKTERQHVIYMRTICSDTIHTHTSHMVDEYLCCSHTHCEIAFEMMRVNAICSLVHFYALFDIIHTLIHTYYYITHYPYKHPSTSMHSHCRQFKAHFHGTTKKTHPPLHFLQIEQNFLNSAKNC